MMDSPAVQYSVGSLLSRLLVWSRTFVVRYAGIGSVMVFLAAWELVVRTLRINELLLPPPSRIAMELVEVSRKGFLWGPLGESLEALALGLAAGVVVGVGLGMLIGTSPRLESLAMPYLWALRATPRIALAPLVMIWLGFRLEAKVFLVFLSVSIVVMLIILESVKTVDGSLIRVARSFGASRKDIVTKVITPYILPSIATGIRNGIGFGFVSVLVVEMFSAVGGLGAQVRRARDSYDSPRMFAFVLVLIVVSLVLINLSRRLEAYVSRWREEAYLA